MNKPNLQVFGVLAASLLVSAATGFLTSRYAFERDKESLTQLLGRADAESSELKTRLERAKSEIALLESQCQIAAAREEDLKRAVSTLNVEELIVERPGADGSARIYIDDQGTVRIRAAHGERVAQLKVDGKVAAIGAGYSEKIFTALAYDQSNGPKVVVSSDDQTVGAVLSAPQASSGSNIGSCLQFIQDKKVKMYAGMTRNGLASLELLDSNQKLRAKIGYSNDDGAAIVLTDSKARLRVLQRVANDGLAANVLTNSSGQPQSYEIVDSQDVYRSWEYRTPAARAWDAFSSVMTLRSLGKR